MKIFAFSDLHGNLTRWADVQTRLRGAGADVVAFAGDLTNFGDREDAAAILESLAGTAPAATFVIHGNCDPAGVIDAMRDSGRYLHRLRKEVGGLTWVGYGDVPPTPFGTHNEFPESNIGADLAALLEPGCAFLCHAPAYGINDEVPGKHAGSTAILKAIQQFRPRLMLHGHIHEAHAMTVYDYDAGKPILYRKFGAGRFTESIRPGADQGLIVNVAAAKDGRIVEIGWADDGAITLTTEIL
jgi:Icc-related predicted phosphoesterase